MKRELPASEKQFCKEIFAAMFKATAGRIDPDKIVYPYDLSVAVERQEKSQYAASMRTDNECTRDIDAAINASCYKTYYYHLDFAVMSAVREYGFEGVNAVLASHI